ncbi:F0F1 ATP synthase subunit gamma [Ralstonia chuxiongensis]|uniref:F0F1 ATP synthase subunit gamma n=1 Tax=Ralstonia chuxiongensis TaxID=2957504 RepID=UPI0028F53A1C|nr:F0F1 ATP synthase subunit gamma [Ralstonia chuxiongensis]CAJ0780302.1 ATP synthase gamma chain [Ralstonia chuxiongensis]
MNSPALREHLHLLDELRQIVTAMRNLAYAELQRLERALPVQARAQACVLQALADIGVAPEQASERKVCLVIGSERGFCGGFNDQLLAPLARVHTQNPDTLWVVAGSRMAERARGVVSDAAGVRGSSNTEDSVSAVDEWFETLHARWGKATSYDAVELRVLHHEKHQVKDALLLPHPPLPRPSPGSAPRRLLPEGDLLPGFRSECLRIGLLGACYTSLVQENKWRLAQMQNAQDHLDELGSRLRRHYFLERQADITSELETLMSSLDIKGMGLSRLERGY